MQCFENLFQRNHYKQQWEVKGEYIIITLMWLLWCNPLITRILNRMSRKKKCKWKRWGWSYWLSLTHSFGWGQCVLPASGIYDQEWFRAHTIETISNWKRDEGIEWFQLPTTWRWWWWFGLVARNSNVWLYIFLASTSILRTFP